MLLASFVTFVGEFIAIIVIFLGGSAFLLHKMFGNNEIVRSTAKEAATRKAVSVIGKFLK